MRGHVSILDVKTLSRQHSRMPGSIQLAEGKASFCEQKEAKKLY
jgi:hypothetical protein